jgi:soluble P-type ATPase
LGATRAVVIGNGAADTPMVEEVGFGIYIMSKKGTSSESMNKADVVELF